MPTSVHQPRTLYDKIWDDHVMYVLGVAPARTLELTVALLRVRSDVDENGQGLIYVDRCVWTLL